jgi:uncharacterized protein (TIGR03000 family)
MPSRAVSRLAMIAIVGLLCLVPPATAAPPQAGLNNPFPGSFYHFNPGYYGPYYPGHYQYGNVQPSTYNNYSYPTFSGTSSSVPLPYSSQPYVSSPALASPSTPSLPSLSPASSTMPALEPAAILILVHVPTPNAEVWVEGWKTTSTGSWRQFLSPPLEPGERYVYEVRAHWFENGREINQTRKVPVRAGEQIIVDFTKASRLK